MVRVAINGFGRIGRLALRLMVQDKDFDVVAINTNSDAETLAYLLKYDTSQGNFMIDKISHEDDVLYVDGKKILTSRVKEPENCNWKELNIDLVIDCTGIVKGLMTTVHAYTNDQNILDNSHKKGINSRRGRSAAANIVPASTGAAAAVGIVLPKLKGKLDGMALRVPTITGSVVDLVVELENNATVEEINKAIKEASNETLRYTEDPIVSSDVIGTTYGCTFDALSTNILEVNGKQMVKLIAWYDNEMSFTAQLVRLAKYWSIMK
jgi:glyceraldehyde 3-phosphate dehydrogenase (phosphorylating)